MRSAVVIGLGLAALLTSNISFAKANEKARLKCHIELLGGEQIIHYKIMPAHQGPTYLDKLKKNKRIIKKRSTIRIFDVFECVPFSQKFTDNKANLLEDSLPQ
ncbi:TapY2 family type IVa secretion system protein [Thalassotalea euphylliae]|uniref:Uncharacterized protein n=1 Tax=Thalassotalea euphylliae TaxID=1655234 RepID=A0A3E0U143_9GAMM|nr:TapY2 family type IVa secretion system protein [Thalassotalea euphylliae]REL30317.1 hypothetical protein DXX94_06115 [Thalassotalea euphylliae]